MKATGSRVMSSVLLRILDVAWFVVAITATLTVLLLLAGVNFGLHLDGVGIDLDAGPQAAMSVPVALELDPDTHPVTAPALGVDRAQLRGLHGALRFPRPRGSFFFANLVIVAGWFALGLWVLTQMRGLFRTLSAGQPFAAANAVRVRRIAWAVIVAELLRATMMYFESAYAMTHFVATGLTFVARPQVDVYAIIDGLIILALAEVFREGTRLDDERSLTI